MPTIKHIRRALPLVAAVGALALLAACSVETRESKDKGNKDVKVETPWGGLSVRTDPDVKDTGLAVYPNARRKPGNDNDRHAANVDINTPMFGLKVVAIEFVSDDAPDKLISFYRDNMKKFGGKFLECSRASYINLEDKDVGFGNENGNELTCGKGHGDAIELKAGTPGNQHVVAIKPSGKGSEFALVFVQKHGKEGNI